jgi:hypothetical protein
VRAAALPVLAVALAACAPEKAPPPARTVALNCARPFADLAREIAALPGVKPAEASGEPYVYYNTEGGQVSYVVTDPKAPAHPAILMQQVTNEGGRRAMRTTGCAYGDRAAFEQLTSYLQGLGEAAKGSGG